MLEIHPVIRPLLEPDFIPASLWNRAYRTLVDADPAARTLTLALVRSDGEASRFSTRVLSERHPAAMLTRRFAERLLKFLLWQRGGHRVLVAGAPEIAAELARAYSATGEQ